MRFFVDMISGYGVSLMALIALLLFAPERAMAVDVLGEYSYMHVSFSSVWHLFLFILTLVMMPFLLMIYHVWRNGPRKDGAEGEASEDGEESEEKG